MKFYAVKKGRVPGIYRSWPEAQKQVKGFSGAEYKAFAQITAATDYLNWNAQTQGAVLQEGEDTLQAAIAKIQAGSDKPNKPAKVQTKTAQQTKTGRYFAVIYTDGGTRNTGNYRGGHVRPTDKAAWAYLIEHEDQQVSAAGGEFGATNNKMEQTALIRALIKLRELGYNEQKLLFVLDSQYVLNAINKKWLQGWKRRGWKRAGGELINARQWQELDRLLQDFPNSTFEWTKGHNNNRGNEFVDHALNVYMDQM